MKRENAERKPMLRPALLAGGVVLLGVIVVLLLCLGGGTADKKDELMNIKTTYVTLKYPKTYKKYLKHQEILEGSDATEVFSMAYEGVEAELFRLCFTANEPENVEGYLETDQGSLYVSVQPYTEGPDLSGLMQDDQDLEKAQEVEAVYYSMMGAMGQVLESVKEDSRYSLVKGVAGNDKQTGEVLYWKVSLPKAITWQSREDDGTQEVAFAATVGEKRISLYTIALNDIPVETTIGQYTHQGKVKYVTVEICDLDAQGPLTQDELTAAHMLMETLNDVLQVIRSDSNFSTDVSASE